MAHDEKVKHQQKPTKIKKTRKTLVFFTVLNYTAHTYPSKKLKVKTATEMGREKK
jgi:hypothetical protein